MVAMLGDHGTLERERMQRRSGDAFREIEAYADLGSGSDRKGRRVTENWRPRGDCDQGAPPESHRLNRAWPDTRRVVRRRNSRHANEEGRRAVFVGKANAHLGPSDRYPHALSHSPVFDLEQRLVWIVVR